MAIADHLEVPRQHGLFHHHGIELGDGTVAHYLEGREILRSSIQDFCAGQAVQIVFHHDASPRRITLKRAISRIGEKKYNLLFNNCEHFANWCKTGKHRSHQMESWFNRSSLNEMMLGQVIPTAILSKLKSLLKEGLKNETSQQKARQGIEQLQHLRKSLLSKLENTLNEIEKWDPSAPSSHKSKPNNSLPRALLLKGQNFEDQLNTIEKLEEQILALLKKSNQQN